MHDAELAIFYPRYARRVPVDAVSVVANCGKSISHSFWSSSNTYPVKSSRLYLL